MKFKSILKKYVRYISTLENRNTKNFTRFITWIKQYIHLKNSEHTFRPYYLPKYEEGQIIFVDFGCGIEHEFSYPHYAIVLNCHDKKNNSLLTIVPLTSKKECHKKLKTFEHELMWPIPSLLGQKAINNFDLLKPEYTELREDILRLAQQKLSHADFNRKYKELVQQGVQAIADNNKDIMELRDKMKEGSIVECEQIRTISKARIISPKKASDPLYNICVSEADLAAIRIKLMRSFVFKNINNNIDSNLPESVQ